MIIIGVDPGKDGAAAFIKDHTLIEVVSFKDRPINMFYKIFDYRGHPTVAFVEKVHSSPQQGVASAFTFGAGYGAILGTLSTLRIPVIDVRPVEWQGALGCLSEGDKKSLFETAKRFYMPEYIAGMFKAPQADAVLIAHYGMKWMQFNKGKVNP